MAIEAELNNYFVEREEVLHGLALAILSQNNMLLLGPPGVAKSLIVREWTKHIVEAQKFEWLLTKFSSPEEVFGPLSLKALEEDRYSRITVNKLPEAHFAFLDEIFKCNSGLLNSLLPVLNERIFHNDGSAINIPLLTVVGASNEIPDTDDGLDAMFDRFLLKFMVKPIQEESNLKKVLMTKVGTPEMMITIDEIHEAQQMVKNVEINSGMADLLIKIRRAMGLKGITSTDRSYNTALNILKAEAFLNGRAELIEDDFDVLRNVLWTDPKDERAVWSVILDLISPEKGKIVSLYEKAVETAMDTLNEVDNKKKVEKGIDTASKLKKIKKDITTYIKAMDAKKKDTREVKRYELKVNELLGRIFTESCGIDPTSATD